MVSVDNIQKAVWNLNSVVSQAKQKGDEDPVITSLVSQMMAGSDATTIGQLADKLVAHLNSANANPYNYELNDAAKAAASNVSNTATSAGLEQAGIRDQYVARKTPEWASAMPPSGVARPQLPEEESYLTEEVEKMSLPARPYSGASNNKNGIPKWAGQQENNQYKDISFRSSINRSSNQEGFMDVKKAHKIALAEANKTYSNIIKKLAQEMAPGLLPGGEISMGEGSNVPAVGKDYGSYKTPAQSVAPNRAAMSLRDRLRQSGADALVNFDYHYDTAKSSGKWGSVLDFYQSNYQPMQVELKAMEGRWLDPNDKAALIEKINTVRNRYARAVQQAQASTNNVKELLKSANTLYYKYLKK